MKSIENRLRAGEIIVLDGAIGTELIRHGIEIPIPLWSAAANLSSPDTVSEIHGDYCKAGADIITANTFRTTTRTYLKTGLNISEASKSAENSLYNAVKAARLAAGPRGIIAGSMAPLEDCYSPELYPGDSKAFGEFQEQGNNLAQAGVDFFLLETMGRIDETVSALNAVAGLPAPSWVTLW